MSEQPWRTIGQKRTEPKLELKASPRLHPRVQGLGLHKPGKLLQAHLRMEIENWLVEVEDSKSKAALTSYQPDSGGIWADSACRVSPVDGSVSGVVLVSSSAQFQLPLLDLDACSWGCMCSLVQ